jgi:Secretion system C-terminal sorting domain/Fungalysin metallopeptidase (M36)
MKKIIILLAAITNTFVGVAQIAHQHENVNASITPYHDAQDAKQNINGLRFNTQLAWQKFVATYPSWGCQFDAYTGMPHRAFGEPIQFGSGDVVNRAKQFLATAFADYQIPMQDLQLTLNKNDGKYINVNFKQIHNGKEVLFSRVTVRFTQDLKIAMVGVDAYNNIPNLQPSLMPNQAIDFAKAAINTSVLDASIETDLKIIAVPQDGIMVYKLVYAVTVNTQDEINLPGKYYTLVDANTGAIIYRQNKVNQIGSHIDGYTWRQNKFSPLLPTFLPNIHVVVGTTTYTANVDGDVNLPGTGPVTGTVKLEGKWCKVVTGATGSVSPSFSATFNGNDTIIFDTTAASTLSTKVNAYKHVNEVHDFMNIKLPTFTGLNNQLLTRVDRTDGTCNAFYNGSSINFYDAGGGCNPTATIADVVYHEYGHGINDKYYTSLGSSFDNGAMGEGYADMWAMSIVDWPVIGPGFFANSATNGIRRYDTDNKVYPKDIVGEVHADGEIIAGAWWDVNINWGNLDSTSSLFANSMAGLATGPDGTEGKVYFDILIDALSYDDNDANLNNGTPHFASIVKAFAKHGIYLLADAQIVHQAYATNVTPNTAQPISANVTVTYPAFLGEIKMFYRLKKSGFSAIDSLLMNVTSGNNFATIFPAKPENEIYEYYIAAFNNNALGYSPVATAFTPTNAPFGITSYERNIPYYLVFGMQALITENFETTAPNWTITSTTDNATAGKWILAKPVGSKINGVLVQTDADHTTGTGQCLVTGNATSATATPNIADVDGGRTTIQSPVFDLKDFKNPVVSYWRWFSNSQGATNPRKDLWRVYISDNGGTNYNMISERTYEPDASWRRQVVKIKDVKAGINTSNIRFLFIAVDSTVVGINGGSWVEAAIDDFEIYDQAFPAGITDVSIQADIYPNPADNLVSINLIEPVKELKINMIDAMGKVVYQQSNTNVANARINTANIAAGIYFLRLTAGEKQSIYKLVVKR